jgi:hypothetical protein
MARSRWPERTVKERFEELYYPVPECGCWLWERGVNSSGYGSLSVGDKTEMAHRVSYELYVGPIPPGLSVLHKCDTRSCVNPDHLFLGTRSDNNLDMSVKGRGRQPKSGMPPGVRRRVRKSGAVKFYATMIVRGRQRCSTFYDSVEAAVDAYKLMVSQVKSEAQIASGAGA